MSFKELGDNNQVLEWRRHALSDVMTQAGQPHLAFEPTYRTLEEVSDRLLRTRIDENNGRIVWSWSHWNKVEAKPSGLNKAITFNRHDNPWVEWKDMPFGNHIEFTPYDDRNEPGVTERKKRPASAYNSLVSMKCDWSNRVKIELPSQFNPSEFYAQLYAATGADAKQNTMRREGTYAFRQHTLEVKLSPQKFRGFICVIHRAGKKEYLVAYRDFDDPNKEMELPDTNQSDVRRLRDEIETAGSGNGGASEPNSWAAQWPGRSQSLLEQLHKEATRFLRMSTTDALEALKRKPLGLSRALVLRHCKHEWNGHSEKLISQLDSLTTFQVLQILLSNVPPDFDKIAPEEKQWIIAHKDDPNIVEVVDWARNHNVNALTRALKLVKARRDAQKIKSELHETCEEFEQVKNLIARINQSPFNNDSLDPLIKEVDNFKNLISADKERPIHPDPPAPITQVQYVKWSEARDRMRLWHLQLARVLTLCETGEWERLLSDEPPTQQELDNRLDRIKVPQQMPRSKEDPRLSEKVLHRVEEMLRNDLIQGLITDKRTQKRSRFYAQALKQLEQIILPHAPQWALWHRDIRRARSRASDLNKFAQQVGLLDATLDLNEKVKAAHKFLDLVESFDNLLKDWKPGIHWSQGYCFAHNQAELKSVLATPSHTRIARAYNRYKKLQAILDERSSGKSANLLRDLPDSPKDASLHAVTEWWEKLRLLDKELGELETSYRRFEREHKDFYVQCQSVIEAWLIKFENEKRKPRNYSKLESLYKHCKEAGDDVARKSILELFDTMHHIQELQGVLGGVSKQNREE